MERKVVISKIQAEDRSLGMIAEEIEKAYHNNSPTASLTSLFALTEQVVKFSLNKTEGNFHDCINQVKEEGIITEEEKEFLNEIREFRNKLFHENLNKWSFTDEDGTIYPLSEQTNRKLLYENKSTRTFEIILKMLRH